MKRGQIQKSLKLTLIEEQVKATLEKAGIKTFKGSYPDFIIYDPKTSKYCLVEVKRDKNDSPSDNQLRTFGLLKKLGIPCYVIHANSISDIIELQESLKPSPETFLSKTERMRFDALASHDSIKGAALSLGLSPSTLYNWRLELRNRYERRRGWINAVLAQTRRGGILTKLLHKKQKRKPPDADEELEEEE